MEVVPTFPPLFRGERAPAGLSPFAKAISAAAMGTDPGLIVYGGAPHVLQAAVVLAPEEPLSEAMAMVFAASLGFADALGALAPPEVGVHFDWPASFRINGARCGGLTVASSTRDPEVEPDWLVIGLELPLLSDRDPGETPEDTVLFEEGCADIHPAHLIESWSRHMLTWIHRYMDDGIGPLHADWRARAFAMGEAVTMDGSSGTFMGLDERGGMLFRTENETRLIPLTQMLEE